jgi:hypothetical protein
MIELSSQIKIRRNNSSQLNLIKGKFSRNSEKNLPINIFKKHGKSLRVGHWKFEKENAPGRVLRIKVKDDGSYSVHEEHI